MYRKLFYLYVLISVLVGCKNTDTSNAIVEDSMNNEKVKLTVSAAASLADVMEEMKEAYEADHNVRIIYNFAGSGKLAHQIEQGAPADVFISASEKWMDLLEEKELIEQATRDNITRNKLVLIGKINTADQIESIDEIANQTIDQIAIGNPESVPAGQYTKELLISLGMWDELQEKFVLAKDVRQVLTYTETGNVNVGFVYKSDARISDAVTIIEEVDEKHHKPIIYPGAIVSDSDNKEEATAFLDFIRSSSGQDILNTYGFQK
ncbi:molybdate ABC transporter substrate-binding protein [Virgibacillus sp. W0430]|uniref:molybdate ABC transporter substrate-binding protein n=1 Tax=Virgibacillus sp. W0430 TaxID=3391580 RepID=UPI003F480B80